MIMDQMETPCISYDLLRLSIERAIEAALWEGAEDIAADLAAILDQLP